MADTPAETLREAITEFIKKNSTASGRQVRSHLNEKFDCDFAPRKQEIEKLAMAAISKMQGGDKGSSEDEEDDDAEDDSGDNYSEDEKPKAKKAPARKAPPPKKKKKTSDSEDEDDDDDEEDSEDDRKKSKKKRASNGAAKAKKAAEPKKAGGGKTTGYLKRLKLSTELAEVMGEEHMARNEVVKKMYAVVKERDLLDPKNRQFAILDEQLQKVFGQKRVRMFGMLKLLGKHFLAAE